MRIYGKIFVGILCVALLSLGSTVVVSAGEIVTVRGIINDNGQLADDSGQLYEIADTDLGWEVMDQVGDEVEVEGEIEEDESGIKVIVVKSFKLIS